jgi:hypothetical protein
MANTSSSEDFSAGQVLGFASVTAMAEHYLNSLMTARNQDVFLTAVVFQSQSFGFSSNHTTYYNVWSHSTANERFYIREDPSSDDKKMRAMIKQYRLWAEGYKISKSPMPQQSALLIL